MTDFALKKMVPTALISSEEHITLILVVASRKVYEYNRKYLCHFFFIKHSPALGWKIIKCKTMEINKRGLNIWILNWWSASRPDAPHHIKTYIKLLEGRTAMRKIFQFVSVLLSLSVIWLYGCPRAEDDLIIYKSSISMHWMKTH